MKTCSNPQCKNLLDDEDKFCTKCGTKWKNPKKSKLLPVAITILSVALLICIICGLDSEGVFSVSQTFCQHDWENASCLSPKYCLKCGKTEGSMAEHTWTEATCTTARTCIVCRKAIGPLLEHTWTEASCETPKMCNICGETQGDALGHDWLPATYSSPQRCARCLKSIGNVKGYIAEAKGAFSEKLVSVGNTQWNSYILDTPIEGCVKFTLNMFLSNTDEGKPYGTWHVYRKNQWDKWTSIGEIDVQSDVFSYIITLEEPTTISEIFLGAPYGWEPGFAASFTITDIYTQEESYTGQNDAEPNADRYLTTITTYMSDGNIWYRHEFDWDENGRLIQVQDVTDPQNITTCTFQYNERGQLLRENRSAGDYSFVNQEYTYSPEGKLLTGHVATEDGDGIREDIYQYDSNGRLYKVIQTDDYSRRETTYIGFNNQGKSTFREIIDTVISTGFQTYGTESFRYDELGRKTEWRYSGSDGEYSMTYRYDVKPFLIGVDEKGSYSLALKDADGNTCWHIDVGYTVLNFQNWDLDTGELEVDSDGFLTRICFKDGSSFEFEYGGSVPENTN